MEPRADRLLLFAAFAVLLHLLLGASSLGVSGVSVFPNLPPQHEVWIPTGRTNFSSVVINDLIFVLGGSSPNNQGDALGHVDVYKTDGTFVRSLDAKMPTPRAGMAVVVVNETLIFTIGGSLSSVDNEPTTSIEMLDVSTPEGQWTVWNNLSLPRVNAKATIGTGGVVVASGDSENGHSSDFLEFQSNQTILLSSLPSSCNIESGLQSDWALGNINGTTLLLCSNGLLFTLNQTSWQTTNSSLMSLRLVVSVDSVGDLFLAKQYEEIEGPQMYTFFSLRSSALSPSLARVQCSETVLFTTSGWVCLSIEDSNGRTSVSVRSTESSIMENSFPTWWSSYASNPQQSRQGGADWDYPPVSLAQVTRWSEEGEAFLAGEGLVISWTGNNQISALNETSGELLWNITFPFLDAVPGIGATGDILVITFSPPKNNPVMVSLDPMTGKQYWKINVEDRGDGFVVPLATGNFIIGPGCSIQDGSVPSRPSVTMYSQDGEVVWQQQFSACFPSAALNQDESVLVLELTSPTAISGIDVLTGNTLWNVPLDSTYQFSYFIGGNNSTVFATFFNRSGNGVAVAIDSGTGETIWNQTVGQSYLQATFSSVNNLLYASCVGDGYTTPCLEALDGETGMSRWQLLLPQGNPFSYLTGSYPIVGSFGNLFIITPIGELWMVDGAIGEVLARYGGFTPGGLGNLVMGPDGTLLVSTLNQQYTKAITAAIRPNVDQIPLMFQV